MLNGLKKVDSPLAQLMKASPDLLGMLREGELVNAVLLKRMPRAVYFDLGKFGTGILYGAELLNAREILKALKEGDSISAKVAEVVNDDGYAELSLSGAGKQKAWQGVKELF